MRYTVYHPQSDPHGSYGSYLHLLEENGVNIADTDRVLEPASACRWLPVWDDEAVAQRFASRMRERSEDPTWTVQPLNGEPITHGPLGPVWIQSATDSYGFVYGLTYETRKVIQRRFPEAKMLDLLILRTRDPAERESRQARLWQQIAEMLTGLTAEQLTVLGGYHFFHQDTKEVWGPAFHLT